MNSPVSKKDEEILKIEEISKWFGGICAVNKVSMAIQAGEKRALIGPNGAGKTTLFNLIAGTMRTNEGKIFFFEKDVTRKSVRARAALGLGRSYQISNLFLSLTVEESLFLSIKGNGFPSPLQPWKSDTQKKDKIMRVAQKVGLTENVSIAVKELSHGQQRQLELGMAIANNPKVVLLDEPAAGLSALERKNMLDLIKNLEREVTLLLVEHDMDIVLGVAEKITVMHQGSVIAEGTPEEIQSDQRVQQVYIGEVDIDQPVTAS